MVRAARTGKPVKNDLVCSSGNTTYTTSGRAKLDLPICKLACHRPLLYNPGRCIGNLVSSKLTLVERVPVFDCISACSQCCHSCRVSCTILLYATLACRDIGDDAENEAPEAPKAMKRLKKQVS